MQHILPHTDAAVNDAPQQAQEFIHNFSDLDWDMDNEPAPNQMYHLLTITGQTIVGTWDADYTLGEHYTAWAPLSSNTLTIH